MERVRRRIETPAEINELTDKPVVGRLPRQRALQRVPASLVWNQERMTGLQESYRALRTNVQFLAEGKRVIEVTSPDPAQGKSTVVANLGAALAQIGVDCVIVDADLRRPTQHKVFGVDNSTGLSTLLSVRNPQIDLKPSGFPNLWVIPSGPLPPDPTEMLHVRFEPLVERLRDLDALILIDTPPVLPVSDARLIAPHCDGVLVVVSRRRAPSRWRSRARSSGSRSCTPTCSASCSTSPATTSRRPAATTTRAPSPRSSRREVTSRVGIRGAEWPWIVLIALAVAIPTAFAPLYALAAAAAADRARLRRLQRRRAAAAAAWPRSRGTTCSASRPRRSRSSSSSARCCWSATSCAR